MLACFIVGETNTRNMATAVFLTMARRTGIIKFNTPVQEQTPEKKELSEMKKRIREIEMKNDIF